MPRIPYADTKRPETTELVEQIVKQRGSVLHLYQMLLNSPAVAAGWLTFLTAIRQQSSLPPDIRELVIIRIAAVNSAPYEAAHHAPIALREGLNQPQLDDLSNWEGSDRFDERQRSVLAYADAMTRQVRVPDEIFAAVRRFMNDQMMVELTATIAAYNMVSRFLVALEIHPYTKARRARLRLGISKSARV